MKKLLSLLSVLTISGTAIPTTIAASPYQKNNLETLNRKKREHVSDNTTDNGIVSSGVVLNNKLYFGSWDSNVYEYDPSTGQQKIVIRTNDRVNSSGVVFNNKLYFGSNDYNVYEYDPITEKQKIVIRLNGKKGSAFKSSGVVLNNKLYFGSHQGNVYEYDPATDQQKIVITTTDRRIVSSGVVFNNKLYVGSGDKNVYEYDPATDQQKIVIRTNGKVNSSGLVSNNKLYFVSYDKNVYEYDPIINKQKVAFTIKPDLITDFKKCLDFVDNTDDETILKAAKDKNSNLDVSQIYVKQKVVNGRLEFGVKSNSNKYNTNSSVYCDNFKIKFDLKDIITNTNLNIFDNNDNKALLNELNYLNHDLDISQLEVTNITNTSATIKTKNDSNKYFGEKKINYIINQQKNINLEELIKKAIFFKFRDENPNLIFKEIKDINTDNLQHSNVEVTKKENSSLLISFDFRNICNSKEYINKTPNVRLFNIPACVYNSKYKLTFQVLVGLTLTAKNQENKLNGWNINSDDEMKLTDFISINNNENTEIISELSDNFDLSNSNKQEQEIIISEFNEKNDKFEVNPNEKLQINYTSLRVVKSKIMLNLKQKITGTINVKIVDTSNKEHIVTVSIKEIMKILKNYDLLPNKITISEDSSIVFNGEGFLSSEAEGKIRTNIITSIV